MWDEIQDMPGEIFDIEDFKVDVKMPCEIALEHDAELLEIHNA
jgi:predicted component of type VI protein secretion system